MKSLRPEVFTSSHLADLGIRPPRLTRGWADLDSARKGLSPVVVQAGPDQRPPCETIAEAFFPRGLDKCHGIEKTMRSNVFMCMLILSGAEVCNWHSNFN